VLRDTFAQIDRTFNWAAGQTAQNLVDNQGYAEYDANVLKSLLSDLHNLSLVAHGGQTVGAATNFFQFATPSLGVH
jgi:hypothetical protein